MKVWFKRVLLSLLAVIVLALAALALFLATFDPNAYKDRFEAFVFERYQRTLSIDGDLQLSLFPRIGIAVQDISLSERNSSDTFASIDSARFAVAIWPLLFNRFVVDHVSIAGLKASVTRDEDGRFNFQDLMRVAGSPDDAIALGPAVGLLPTASAQTVDWVDTQGVAERDEAALQIDIAGLDLRDGEVHFYDEVTSYVMRLVQLQLHTGRMTFDQPFDVSLRGHLLGEYPELDAGLEGQALVKVDPLQKAYSAQKLNLQLAGQAGIIDAKSATLRGNLAYNGYSRMLDASNIELLVQGATRQDPQIRDLQGSLIVPQLKLDRSRSEYRVDRLALRARGNLPSHAFDVAVDAPRFSISPEEAEGEPVVGTFKLDGKTALGLAMRLSGLGGNAQNVTLKELTLESSYRTGDRLLQVNLSSPAQWAIYQEQGSLSAIKGDVRVEDAAIPAGSFEFPLIGSLQADLLKDQLSSDVNAVLNGSPINFNWKAVGLADPKVTFRLQADTLNLDTMFPSPAPVPVAPAPQPAQASPAPAEQPPAPQQDAPTDAPPPTPIDLRVLNDIDVTGTVAVGDLTVRNLNFKNFSVATRAAQGSLQLANLTADLNDGVLTGQAVASSDNTFETTLALDKVAMGPLGRAWTGQEPRITGQGSIKLNLQSQGATPEALASGLNGTVEAKVRDGAVRGIDFLQTLREIDTLLNTVLDGEGPALATQFDLGRQTEFASLDANLGINGGVADVKMLNIQAPMLRITQGSPARLDLVGRTIDLVAQVRLAKASRGSGKELAALRGVTVPVHLTGSIDAPDYQVQWNEISSKLIKGAVERGLLDFLARPLPEEAVPELQVTPAEPPAEEPDSLKSLGDALLKGLLKR